MFAGHALGDSRQDQVAEGERRPFTHSIRAGPPQPRRTDVWCHTSGVKRERAVTLVEELLTRLVAGTDEWPLSLIADVYVFGSFARGSLEPHDVDVAIRFERDRDWGSHFATCLSYGRNPYTIFRKPLVGRRPGIQFLFEPDRVEFEMELLWHRGDPLEAAIARLMAIAPDPSARRAPRDAMLPEFEGLDRWIPLWCREAMVAAVKGRTVNIDRLALPNAETAHPIAVRHLHDRWKDSSPLFRAAGAVVSYAEQRGIDPRAVWLHGEAIDEQPVSHFADFGLRYFRSIPYHLADRSSVEWLAIVRPTRRQPLEALRITPLDRGSLGNADWS